MTINEIYTILLGILILMPGILGTAVFKYFMNVEFKKEIPFFLFLYTIIEFAAIIWIAIIYFCYIPFSE